MHEIAAAVWLDELVLMFLCTFLLKCACALIWGKQHARSRYWDAACYHFTHNVNLRVYVFRGAPLFEDIQTLRCSFRLELVATTQVKHKATIKR